MQPKKEREQEILFLYQTGKTTIEIGEKFGITRQRVQQILKKYGLERKHGGSFVRHQLKEKREQKERKDKKIEKLEKWMNDNIGISLQEAERINGEKITAVFSKKFRHTAIFRYFSVRWQRKRRQHFKEEYLSFEEWAKVWENAGLWILDEETRCWGPKAKYSIAKKDESLPWSIENSIVVAPPFAKNRPKNG